MQAIDHNGVKVYDLCVGKTLPQWLTVAQKNSLRKNTDFRRRIELIQDFDFNTASQRVRMCNDNVHIVATGVYPPQVKVFDVRELSMKFERHLDAEVIQFETLADDYTKLVFLGANRTLDFHAAYGFHHRIRIPTFGRDLSYDPFGCELYVGAGAGDVYRVDLEQGTFMEPFSTPHETGVNVTDFSLPLQLLSCGGADGVVSMWDVRARARVGLLDMSREAADGIGSAVSVTALRMEPSSGLVMAVGLSDGQALVYDIRSSRPLQRKHHANELPIVSLQFQRPGKLLVSADPKGIKVWNRDTGKAFCNMEPQGDVNEVHLVETGSGSGMTSGLIFAAGEMQRIMAFYVPRLGQAPKWASFLDNLTEELEETNRTSEEVYDNYKFVQQADLERLGVANLVGTPLLRVFMHGYFMDMRLYRRLKSVSEPMAFESWRKEQIKKKMEDKVSQRIARKAPAGPKVNSKLAGRVSQEDNRFKAFFEDDDFAVDEESDLFKQVYPSGLGGPMRGAPRDQAAAAAAAATLENGSGAEDGDDAGVAVAASKPRKKLQLKGADAKDSTSATKLLLGAKSAKRRHVGPAPTVKEKLRDEVTSQDLKLLPGGNMEVSFVPKASDEPSTKRRKPARGPAGRSRTAKR